MSYTTRCPACGTTFKVVPDQLKISDGWVRCGHCADVFDATLYLQEWVPPAPLVVSGPGTAADQPPQEPAGQAHAAAPSDPHREVSPPAPQPSAPPAVVQPMRAIVRDEAVSAQSVGPDVEVRDGVATRAEAPPADGDTVPADLPSPAHAAPQIETHVPTDVDVPPPGAARGAWAAAAATHLAGPVLDAAPDAAHDAPLSVGETPSVGSPAAEARDSDFHAELSRFAEAAGRPVPDAADAPPAVSQAPAQPGLHGSDEAEVVAEAAEPGFVRQARRQAFWRSPAVRVGLAVLALLLGGLLGAQWAVHERDALAASHPELAPLLTQLCAPLGCELGPVRRIDAVVIDSSTLARRLGNFYAFDVVIKNTATIPVAVPALELSLTDTRDSVIARRVFLQNELPGAPALLPPQGSLPLSLRLSITDAGAVSMAGYRVLVFYP